MLVVVVVVVVAVVAAVVAVVAVVVVAVLVYRHGVCSAYANTHAVSFLLPQEAQAVEVFDKILSSPGAGSFLRHAIIVLNRADQNSFKFQTDKVGGSKCSN
jgi:hypothetical protein